jgi:hypothetical protein
MSLLRSHDAVLPVRSPLSKGSISAAIADMADVILRLAPSSPDGTVTRDDLHDSGFTNGEIDACWPDAITLAASRFTRKRAA